MDETESTTTRHTCISEGIFQSFEKVLTDHEFDDFKVDVNGEIFSCHSFILAACSEFFSGLLRSDMREKKEMKVELNNISPSTFQLIVNSLYTGCDFITKENVLDVWSAVHQLQIQFMIEHCEDFVLNDVSLDTIEMYKEQAEYLQSEKVQLYLFNFMLNNFDQLRENDAFLHLDFDYLMRLVESDKLNVISEDSVLFSIFKWVNHDNICTTRSVQTKASITEKDVSVKTELRIDFKQNIEELNSENSHVNLNINSITEDNQTDWLNLDTESNDRKHLLIHLLKASRYYLASETCIVKLYKLIQHDTLVREILFEALHFKLCGNSQNYCPSPAINRECSNIENVGVICNYRSIEVISFKEHETSCIITKLPKDLDATITIFKGQLFVCLLGISPTKVYTLQNNSWERVTKIDHDVKLFLAHEMHIYCFDTHEKHITRFYPDMSPVILETFTHEIDQLLYGLSLGNKIVLFSSIVNNGEEETAVHFWNTETNVWTKHANLKLVAPNLQSFRDDANTYILDVYGNLWKLVGSETIGFTFVAKLWTEKYNIKGAILFRETLHLMVGPETDIDINKECDDLYTSACYWEVGDEASNVLHYTMPRSEIEWL